MEQLITAQRALGGWGERASLSFDGLQIPRGAILRSTTYDLERRVPAQLASAPKCLISYFVESQGGAWAGEVPSGTLASELLTHLGFDQVGLRLLGDGFVLTWGDRVWHGLSARVALLGSGPSAHLGLSHLVLEAEAHVLVNRAFGAVANGFRLLPILELSELVHREDSEAEDLLATCGCLRMFVVRLASSASKVTGLPFPLIVSLVRLATTMEFPGMLLMWLVALRG